MSDPRPRCYSRGVIECDTDDLQVTIDVESFIHALFELTQVVRRCGAV